MIRVWHLDVDRADAADRELRIEAQTAMSVSETQALAVGALWDAGCYVIVAEVEGTDRTRAWQFTNNIDTSWSMQPAEGVKVLAPLPVVNGKTYGLRSSMVGDIMEVDGVFYALAGFGYTKLSIKV